MGRSIRTRHAFGISTADNYISLPPGSDEYGYGEKMYTLTRLLSNRAFVTQQLPTLGGSLVVAELFFKFGSFTLEALAFLATWFVLDLVYHAVRSAIQGSSQPRTT